MTWVSGARRHCPGVVTDTDRDMSRESNSLEEAKFTLQVVEHCHCYLGKVVNVTLANLIQLLVTHLKVAGEPGIFGVVFHLRSQQFEVNAGSYPHPSLRWPHIPLMSLNPFLYFTESFRTYGCPPPEVCGTRSRTFSRAQHCWRGAAGWHLTERSVPLSHGGCPARTFWRFSFTVT